MNLKARLAIIFILLISLVATATGTEQKEIKPLAATDFRPVLIAPGLPTPVLVPALKAEDPLPTPTPSPKPSKAPKRETPKPKPKIVKTVVKPIKTYGRKTSGTASWYCLGGVSRCTRGHPDGYRSYYAAIRRDLLFLRGRRVNVCAAGKCLPVRIIDCNCGKHANLIDLYADAFRYFYPTSKGRFKVTVKW